MLLEYTRNRVAQNSVIQTATQWRNSVVRADVDRVNLLRGQVIAFGDLTDSRRGQNPRGAWFFNYPQSQPEMTGARRVVGLDDDGIVRFIDLAAGSMHNGLHPETERARLAGAPGGFSVGPPVVYDEQMWWAALDTIYLIGKISEACAYRSSWLLGVRLIHMRDRYGAIMGDRPCRLPALRRRCRRGTAACWRTMATIWRWAMASWTPSPVRITRWSAEDL